jgi:hypothetical protein
VKKANVVQYILKTCGNEKGENVGDCLGRHLTHVRHYASSLPTAGAKRAQALLAAAGPVVESTDREIAAITAAAVSALDAEPFEASTGPEPAATDEQIATAGVQGRIILGDGDHAVEWERGRAVQVDPIKPTLKAPGTKRLKLKKW